MEACYKAANEVYAEISAAKNADFKKIYDNMIAFRSDQYLWWQVAEYTFDTFMIRQRARRLDRRSSRVMSYEPRSSTAPGLFSCIGNRSQIVRGMRSALIVAGQSAESSQGDSSSAPITSADDRPQNRRGKQ